MRAIPGSRPLAEEAKKKPEDVGGREPVLTVRAARVDNEAVEVAVVDQGPPVPDEVFADMFEPFFTTRPEGLGMGLAICRTIIEAHGGTLTARRNEGTGLTVAFRLPLANDTGPASR